MLFKRTYFLNVKQIITLIFNYMNINYLYKSINYLNQ